jgi:hypothetical protein
VFAGCVCGWLMHWYYQCRAALLHVGCTATHTRVVHCKLRLVGFGQVYRYGVDGLMGCNWHAVS